MAGRGLDRFSMSGCRQRKLAIYECMPRAGDLGGRGASRKNARVSAATSAAEVARAFEHEDNGIGLRGSIRHLLQDSKRLGTVSGTKQGVGKLEPNAQGAISVIYRKQFVRKPGPFLKASCV